MRFKSQPFANGRACHAEERGESSSRSAETLHRVEMSRRKGSSPCFVVFGRRYEQARLHPSARLLQGHPHVDHRCFRVLWDTKPREPMQYHSVARASLHGSKFLPGVDRRLATVFSASCYDMIRGIVSISRGFPLLQFHSLCHTGYQLLTFSVYCVGAAGRLHPVLFSRSLQSRFDILRSS